MSESFITNICSRYVFFRLEIVITLQKWVLLVVFNLFCCCNVRVCAWIQLFSRSLANFEICVVICFLLGFRNTIGVCVIDSCIVLDGCVCIYVSVSKNCQNFIVKMICAWLWLHLYVFIHVQKGLNKFQSNALIKIAMAIAASIYQA